MNDANFWMAAAAGITIIFQVFVAAYFYGALSQRVKNISEASDEWRSSVRTEFKEIKEELKNLRNKLFYRGYTSDKEP